MKKDIVKNAVICLSHLEIEDTTYKIARDIVIEEYEQQKEEIERLNNIINELEKWLLWRYENGSESISFRESFLFVIDKIKELKGGSSNGKTVENNG